MREQRRRAPHHPFEKHVSPAAQWLYPALAVFMKTGFSRFITVLFLMLAASFAFAPKALAQADFSVNSLRIGTHPDKTRIVIDVPRRTDFRAFILQNPARLVVDLPSFVWNAGRPDTPPGSLTGPVRHGLLQPGISRIVIDLQKPATLKSAFFLPAGASVSDRVVIDIAPAPPGWNPAQERMFGSLGSVPEGGAPSSPPPAPRPAQAKEQSLRLPPSKPGIQADKQATLEETSAITTPPPAAKARSGKSSKKPVIVIDAGHGGQDPGAIGANGMNEKTITLAAAKELKKQLEATGRYRVHLTRDKDRFIKLHERVKMGRQFGADLFISLHADSIDKAGVSGASIYTLSNTASDAQTERLAARENRADLIAGVDLSHEDKDVANILIDLAMRDTMNQSKFFANTVVKKAKGRGIRLLERPHRFAGFAVLKAPDVPSVLLEMGFMSNRKEVDQLSSPAYRRALMSAVAEGIDAYFAKVHKSGQDG